MAMRSGSWHVYSEKDKRWNGSGSASSVGGFSMPPEAKAHIEKMEKKLGEKPDDLEWGYMKD